MNLLFLGDVVGRAGRDAVCEQLPHLRHRFATDACVVNGENAAGGFGITPEIYHSLRRAGADVVTTGNHVWDQRAVMPLLDREPQLIRAANFPESAPGRGLVELTVQGNKKLVVVHVMGQVFMPDHLDCPFAAVDKALKPYRLGHNVDAIVVDIHAEASSEKMALGAHLDGKVSLVIGTHTHVPTADERILPGGTAYQSDTGMCGDYDSIIGYKKEAPLQRFLHKRKARMEAAMGSATLCGLHVKLGQDGLARQVERVQEGGILGSKGANGRSDKGA
jgi:hypothetical protein